MARRQSLVRRGKTIENLRAFVDAVQNAKPAGAKGWDMQKKGSDRQKVSISIDSATRN